MMRIALVGCGHIGTVHSFALKQLADAGEIDARIVTTFDTDAARAEAMAAPHRAIAAVSLAAALDAADVAWICTWTAAHLEAVEAAVDRGLPVFCEKPLAPTLAECERVAELLRRVPHQVGLVLRHAPVFVAAAEAVASGRHGRLMTAILRDDQYFPIQGMYGSTWRGDVARAGGGTLIEHSVHDVDILCWIAGDPVEVAARTGSHSGHAGIEDVATAMLTHPGGVATMLVSVWHQVLSRPSTRRLELFCENAVLWTDDDYLGPLHVETTEGSEQITAEPPDWVARFSLPEVLAKSLAQYADPAKRFLDGLAPSATADRLGSPDAGGYPDVDAALTAHRIVAAAYRSAAASGRPVALDAYAR